MNPPQPSTGDSKPPYVICAYIPCDNPVVLNTPWCYEHRIKKPTPTTTDTELKGYIFDLTDKHFPKGKCKERGHAMVLVAEALMAIGKHDHRIALEAQRAEVSAVPHEHSCAVHNQQTSCNCYKQKRIAEIDTQLTGEGVET